MPSSSAALQLLASALVAGTSVPIYKNSSYNAAQRAADLLPRLTWSQKVGQMGGVRRLLGSQLSLNQTNVDILLETQNGILGK